MKVLVAFYSRHGHTKNVGEKLAKLLKADIEEISDTKDRSRLATWFASAFDEELKTPTKINIPQKDPSKYDLVVIGTPIWDGIVPPVKSYLEMNKGKFKKVAFFSTFGASAEDAFYVMSEIIKKNPIAVMEIQDRQVILGEDKKRIEEFCKTIKR
jgi:flavodoxin